jgi:hypothetical protein
MKWTYKMTNKALGEEGSEPSSNSYDLDIKFSDLDPVSIKVEKLEPDTSFYNSQRIDVKAADISPDTWKVMLSAKSVPFLFQDREMAKRVAKAFQNAVQKCGGKVEPF